MTIFSEDAMGGVENLTNDTPKKGFWTPPRTVRFPPPSGVSALLFLYKNPRQSRPEALWEGSKNFRESAFSGTFSSPPYVLHPLISRPKFLIHHILSMSNSQELQFANGVAPRKSGMIRLPP